MNKSLLYSSSYQETLVRASQGMMKVRYRYCVKTRIKGFSQTCRQLMLELTSSSGVNGVT
jgi:hypothetical protein